MPYMKSKGQKKKTTSARIYQEDKDYLMHNRGNGSFADAFHTLIKAYRISPRLKEGNGTHNAVNLI